jgi:hypothetical protein
MREIESNRWPYISQELQKEGQSDLKRKVMPRAHKVLGIAAMENIHVSLLHF